MIVSDRSRMHTPENFHSVFNQWLYLQDTRRSLLLRIPRSVESEVKVIPASPQPSVHSHQRIQEYSGQYLLARLHRRSHPNYSMWHVPNHSFDIISAFTALFCSKVASITEMQSSSPCLSINPASIHPPRFLPLPLGCRWKWLDVE